MPSETLFITRAFPPMVGGMQNYAVNLYEHFRKHHRVKLIALRRPPRHLVWFAPFALAQGLVALAIRPISHIYVGDAVMAPVGLLLGALKPTARTVATVHGLDLTFSAPPYQLMVKHCLPRFDRIVCNSRATARVALEKGVQPEKLRVIPCGISPREARTERSVARRSVAQAVGISLDDRLVVVTVGRLVRRKGASWFASNVVPKLDERALYIVIGDGPDFASLHAAALNHPNKVLLLGRASDELRDLVLDAADALVMPNLPVPGDMEGFGIVALEAGVRGLPVVASRIEGIIDAVENGVTGFLVDPGDPDAFVEGIHAALKLDRSRIPETVLARCEWGRVFEEYVQFIELHPSTEQEHF